MKVYAQDIPPELAAAYADVASTIYVDKLGVAKLRKKPGVSKPKNLFAPAARHREYEKAVVRLMEYRLQVTGVNPPESFFYEQMRKLKLGEFDPLYWEQCSIASSDTIVTHPSYAVYSAYRNYGYPDPVNEPTMAVYENGWVTSGLPYAVGMTIDNVYRDTELKWKRIVFSLKKAFNWWDNEPVFLRITGNITADANMRPSRAMLSVIFKRWFVPNGDARLTTLEPPTFKPKSALWRYRTPRGVSPYFHYTHSMKMIFSLRMKKYETLTEPMTKCVVLISPMPMMGYRYNNNHIVESELNATYELWQIRQPAFYLFGVYNYKAHRYQSGAGSILLDTGGLAQFSTPAACSTNGKQACGATGNPTCAFFWDETAGMILIDYPGVWWNLRAKSISHNGAVIAGIGSHTSGERAFRWSAADGIAVLPPAEAGWDTYQSSISGDGSTIVGDTGAGVARQACYWIGTGAPVLLPGVLPIPSHGWWCEAFAVSSDGMHIVGATYDQDYGWPCWWPNRDAPVLLGSLPGGTQGIAKFISPDATVIAGEQWVSGQYRPWLWTVETGLVELAPLTGYTSATVTGITFDSTRVFGYSGSVGAPVPVVWEVATLAVSGISADFTYAGIPYAMT